MTVSERLVVLRYPIRFRVDRAAHQLAEGAVLFTALGQRGGVEGVLGEEVAAAGEPLRVEAAALNGGPDGAAVFSAPDSIGFLSYAKASVLIQRLIRMSPTAP
jgi:hypothetical protein